MLSVSESCLGVSIILTGLRVEARLKVSSEDIPEKTGESVISYTVRVTVTNINDEPISKVLITIFPYIGDRLYEH